MTTALARIGLGSNSGDAAANLERALQALRQLGRVIARSALYRSPPWGEVDQPDFVNAAALLETAHPPAVLLAELKALEGRLGRIPTYRWGPRVIDLDILAYDDVRTQGPELTLPHPRLQERAFALVPLAEIDPAYAVARDALPPAEVQAVQRIPAATARRRQIVDWDETLARVRSAAAFCASAGLTRFRIDEEELGIEVRRSVSATAARVPAASASEGTPAHGNGVSHTNGANGSATAERSATILRAEFVGIVRFSRPAVVPGVTVAAERELAYVESLGIRNPVRTARAGRVSEVFVADGAAVEYGQALFSLEA